MKPRLVLAVFLALAALDALHAIRTVDVLSAHGGIRPGLLALHAVLRTAIASLFAYFVAARPQPRRPAREPLAFLACAVAMLAVVPVKDPASDTTSGLLLAGDAIAAMGSLWILASVLVLGRCFGVLPEARGLVTHGPYRLVRHPVYLGEITALGGLTIAVPALSHFAIFAIFVLAQSARMGLEERALSEVFPDYIAYAATTPRLLPAPRVALRDLLATLAGLRPLRWLIALFALSCAVGVVTGCGAASDPPVRLAYTSIARSHAHAVARAVTIRAGDLPEFKATAHPSTAQTSAEVAREVACPRPIVSSARETRTSHRGRRPTGGSPSPWAFARSPQLSAGSGYHALGASSSVRVMPAAADARLGVDRAARQLRQEARCLEHRADRIRLGVLRVRGIVVRPLSVSVAGASASFAYHLVMAARGAPLVLYVNVVAFAYGQDAIELNTYHASKPVPPAMQERLLALLVARARAHSR